jgi:hypothetical protein
MKHATGSGCDLVAKIKSSLNGDRTGEQAVKAISRLWAAGCDSVLTVDMEAERKLMRRKGESRRQAEMREQGWRKLAAGGIVRADTIVIGEIRTELRIMDVSNVCSADPFSPEFRLFS